MDYKGFILHHSRCSSINGKGFDFWIAKEGGIYAAPLLTDPEYIHICLEGDYSSPDTVPEPAGRGQQLFAAGKLILELAARYRISPLLVEGHDDSCPGAYFPWKELVIYPADGYH
ncbi:N-acetylmuramoyl-L-alanine amidase [Paenibacillus tepidiphilus]|uniref:N-acetylmuramoyl-L-alanine amidase n=1 Tax=Paenibacillus tepidiphilus TaxID=2608683 RepID=UPI00123ABBC5|nr:N-acetylmuramoyl-L-alanine amidase [Paenibacillus tepidiphilus]